MLGVQYSQSVSQGAGIGGPVQYPKGFDARFELRLSQYAAARRRAKDGNIPATLPSIGCSTNYNGFASRNEELAFVMRRQVGWPVNVRPLVHIVWLGHKLRDAHKSDQFEDVSRRNRSMTRDQYILRA